MGWFIVILLLVAGAFYAYHVLMQMEREIRAEIVADSLGFDKEEAPKPDLQDSEATTGTSDAGEKVLSIIRENPGIFQKDVYPLLVGINKKSVQKLLLNYDRSGKVLRESVGSTYKLTLSE